MDGIVVKQLVFLGQDAFSNTVLQSLLDAGHGVSLVATPYYDNFVHKKLESTCRLSGIPFRRIRDVNGSMFLDEVKRVDPQLIVSVHFEKLIGKELLGLPVYGSINLHPSMLPDYRGMAPQHWPIANSEKYTAVTVHYMDEGVDTGPILVQQQVALDDSTYVADLQLRFLSIYRKIVVDAISTIENGTALARLQAHLPGRYYPKLKRHECEIFDHFDVRKAYAYVRAFSKPYFGAYYKNTIIWKAHILPTYTADNQHLGLCRVEGTQALNLSDGILVMDKYEHVHERTCVENIE